MKIYQDKEKLEQAYKELHSAKAVGEKYGHNEKTILHWLHKHNIDVTPKGYGARKYSVNANYFKKIDDEHKAYWLGFIYADGCVFHGSSPNSYRIQINQKASAEYHLKALLKDIKSDYPIYHKKVTVKGKIYKTIALHIDNTDMALDLVHHGIVPRKTYCDTIPCVPENLLSHFFRGFFDGDGCISCKKNRKNSWRFECVCRRDFAEYMQQCLANINVTSYIYPTKSENMFSLTVLSQSEIKDIGEWLYNNSSIFLKSKHDKFLKAMSYRSEMNDSHLC